MGKHNHVECEHLVSYCKVCRIVYCEKCDKLWYESSYTWVYPNTIPVTNTGFSKYPDNISVVYNSDTTPPHAH